MGLERETSCQSKLGLEAAKTAALSLRVSTHNIQFGVVKKGQRYQASVTLTNTCCNGLRWRINTVSAISIEELQGRTNENQSTRLSVVQAVDMIGCITPRGRLAPGMSVKLTFELQAIRTGQFNFVFHVHGREDNVRSSTNASTVFSTNSTPRMCAVELESNAIIIGAQSFRGHLCRMRYERKPLLAIGVKSVGSIPSSRVVHEDEDHAEPETDGQVMATEEVLPRCPSDGRDGDFRSVDGKTAVSDDEIRVAPSTELPSEAMRRLTEPSSDKEADELASLPYFPSCVYDPKTLRLSIDIQQLQVQVDPTVSLHDVLTRQKRQREGRMRVLERGGLITGRVLSKIQQAAEHADD